MRFKGTIVEWRDDRGFGFIEPNGGGERVFCHVKAFAIRVRRPMPGDEVTYGTVRNSEGRVQATEVRPLGLEDARYNANVRTKGTPKRHQPRTTRSSPTATPSFAGPSLGVMIFFVVITALVVKGRIPIFVPIIYLIMSGITIFAYAFDKSAAMNRRWRTQEQTLHLLELLGGWPGAAVAQVLFRHKSRKTSFREAFWICTIVNIVGLGWYVGVDDWRHVL